MKDKKFLENHIEEHDNINRHTSVKEEELTILGYENTGTKYKHMMIWKNEHHGLLIQDFCDNQLYVYLKYDLPTKR